MSIETNQQNHWILDYEYSSIREESNEKKIVFDSIIALVDKNVEQNELIEDSEIDDYIDYEFDEIPKLLSLPKPRYVNYISKSQNWIGIVLEIDSNSFVAKLEDKKNPTTYEIAHFDIDEVSPEDLSLLKVGSLFYWSVGYANQNGQVIKQSLIRFKRAVDISEDEFEGIAKDVDELLNSLNWD